MFRNKNDMPQTEKQVNSEKFGEIKYKIDSNGEPWFFSVDIIRAMNYSVDNDPLEDLLDASEITDTGFIALVAVYKMAYVTVGHCSIDFLRWLAFESGIIPKRKASVEEKIDAIAAELYRLIDLLTPILLKMTAEIKRNKPS
jgi:hypothetical protein